MDPKCRAAVQAAAAGRKISDQKMDEIERSLREHMRRLAGEDTARWRTLSKEQRMQEAATRAMDDIQAAAARKEHNAALQVLRSAETDVRVQRQQAAHAGATRTEALNADLQQAENRVQAVRNEAISTMTDVLDAAASGEGVGLGRRALMWVFGVDNPRMTADMVREVFKGADGSTGNTMAQKAARAWLDTIEQMRQRFNAAGGDIGKLDYGYLTQIHDQMKVLRASRDAWVSRVLPLLNRRRYLAEDGTLMSDDAVRDLLRAAWETISTGGDNKTAPGAFKGTGARANRGSEARVLHFADGDAWMAYMKEFGEGSLYDSMVGHVTRMARDTALVEQYGPNPAHTVRTQADIADRMDRQVGALRDLTTNDPMTLWDLVSGNAGAPENATLARWASGLRNVQTAAKITAGPLAAFGDMATIATTLHFNRLPWFDMLRNLKGMNAEQRAFLTQHGVIAESLLGDIHRFTGDTFTHDWTGRATSAVMKLSLMNAWTDSLRRAFSATMMQNFATKLGKAWGDLDEWDRMLMQRKGIGEEEWSVISRAAPVERNGRQYLTPAAIREAGGADAATKWTAFVTDEAQFAVVNPDLSTRALITAGAQQAGTWSGEVARSMGQFKSFPAAMITRHWRRILDTPQGLEGAPAGFRGETASGELAAKVGMLAALMVSATLLGAIQTQGRQIMTGKDPIDMTGDHAGKFWLKAFAAGGGSGFFGDVLLAPADDPSRQWEGHLGLLGPVAGAAGGLMDIVKDKHHSARAAKWVNDQLPGVDIWYLRALWEHSVLHNSQEALNPGYLGRMQRRAQKDWGQDWWWTPGELAPDRAPDVLRAVGVD